MLYHMRWLTIRHLASNAHNSTTRVSLSYRVLGIFWLLVGVGACAFVLLGVREYNSRILIPLGVCSLLVLCSYRLVRGRKWAAISCGTLVSLITLWLLDMVAMLVFHYDFDLPFYLACVGVIAGGFSVIVLVFAKLH